MRRERRTPTCVAAVPCARERVCVCLCACACVGACMRVCVCTRARARVWAGVRRGRGLAAGGVLRSTEAAGALAVARDSRVDARVARAVVARLRRPLSRRYLPLSCHYTPVIGRFKARRHIAAISPVYERYIALKRPVRHGRCMAGNMAGPPRACRRRCTPWSAATRRTPAASHAPVRACGRRMRARVRARPCVCGRGV